MNKLIEYDVWSSANNYKCPCDDFMIVDNFNCMSCPHFKGEVHEDGKHFVKCDF